MQIYAQEKLDGLEDILRSSASISYASMVEPYKGKKDVKQLKSIASFDDDDLYYVQSILVSSSWNKNDDIFDKIEIWNAKNTPEHKPTNLEHQEKVIVGHIISNWPITEDGILIDENTPIENLPEKYHILTGSVIYKGFSDTELMDRALKLIAEIENGTKYVSMECFFRGFDYGVLNKETGEYKVLVRNNETAYLTKYLRAYGGLGEHENYKIGRVLRNITFSGKGFVDRPANEDSIIFTKHNLVVANTKSNIDRSEEKNEEIVQSGVLNFQSNINSETLTMSSAKEEVAMSNTENIVETPEVTQTNDTAVADMAAKIEELTGVNDKLQAELAAANTAIETIKDEAAKYTQAEIEKKDLELQSLKNELEATLEVLAAYKDKEAEMMKQEKKLKRKATLIEHGLDTETAMSVVDKFESMEDEAFDAMASFFAAVSAKKTAEAATVEPVVENNETTTASASDNADPAVLDSVEVEEEINLSVGGEAESAMDSTRAALVEFVYSKLGKKTSK